MIPFLTDQTGKNLQVLQHILLLRVWGNSLKHFRWECKMAHIQVREMWHYLVTYAYDKESLLDQTVVRLL